MKLSVLLLFLALPGAALAQASPQPQATASATTEKSAGSTVSGVTVEARRPQKSCSSRDEACVAAVVAELKARYPRELRKWCDTVSERTAMTNIMIDDLNGGIATPHTRSESGQFYAPAVTKVACAPDPAKK